jgi:hypothetical protein
MMVERRMIERFCIVPSITMKGSVVFYPTWCQENGSTDFFWSSSKKYDVAIRFYFSSICMLEPTAWWVEHTTTSSLFPTRGVKAGDPDFFIK